MRPKNQPDDKTFALDVSGKQKVDGLAALVNRDPGATADRDVEALKAGEPAPALALIIFQLYRFSYHITTTSPHHPIGLLHLRVQYWEKVSVRAASDSACKGLRDGAADAYESHIPLVLFAVVAQVQLTAPHEER